MPPPASSEPSPKKPSSLPLVVISIAVVLLAGGLWYHHATSQDYIERLESQARSSADQARQAEQKAQQALDSLSEQRRMLTSLRSELQESQAELQGLGTAFQTITDRGSDLVLLNDIDHLVMIAQQQLQLNGNVANAIISLETAQAQLARANRPALASLQQTINGDLDRLRAATTVDIALLSSRLDELAGLIPQAPLLVPDDAVSELERTEDGSTPATKSSPSTTNSTEGEWWEKALARSQDWATDTFASLRHELGQFVSVRRVDDSAALLISPDQASRFRDSLRQRIMTAQLALMMDQSLIWETETDALLKAIQSRFDPQSRVTRQAIRVAREVADTAIDSPLPDVSNTIKALEAMNEQMGRGSLPPQSSTDTSAQTNEAPTQEAAEPSGDEAASDNTPSSDAVPGDVDDAGSTTDRGSAEATGNDAEPDSETAADSPAQADNNESDVNNAVSPTEEESGMGDSEQTTNGVSGADDPEQSEAELTDDTTSGGDAAAVQDSDNTGLKL